MSKFKIGDTVIPEGFEREDTIFDQRMYDLVGKQGVITNIDNDPDEHHYQIHGWWWPESTLTLASIQDYLKEFATPDDELKSDFRKQTQKQLPTLVAEPSRKTLGDFMLAALTGLIASGALGSDIIAERSIEYAKAAFELYEKEIQNGK